MQECVSAQQVVVNIYLALEKVGLRNLVERTRAAARAIGFIFSNAECSRWLRAFVEQRKKFAQQAADKIWTEPKSENSHNHKEKRPVKRRSGRDLDSCVANESLDLKLITTPPVSSKPTESVPQPAATTTEQKATKVETKPSTSKPQPDMSWVQPMRSAVEAISQRTLETLGPDERFALGQYHAWRFGNCTKREWTNRARARDIAAGIRNLANDKYFGSMTVAQYVAQGHAVWKAGMEMPWFKPWDITARFDPKPRREPEYAA